MLISYSNGEHTIVTTTKREEQAVKEFFGIYPVGCGWDIEEFNRVEYKDDSYVMISNGDQSVYGSE